MSGFDLFGDVSTADTGERNAFDYYPTPAWMTRSLLHFHPAIAGTRVLEPCAGGDAITNVLRAAGCDVHTNDIDTRHRGAGLHEDATNPRFWLNLPWDIEWVITNPPFAVAFDILRLALESRFNVALLLRKTFLEPTEERGPWLAANPPTRAIGMPRYSFRGAGSDSVSCDWYLWERKPDRTLPPFVIDHVAERRVR